MRGDGYSRPRLCRLCECPVVDGGVRLRKPRIDKLSRWTQTHWDIRIEQKNCFVCYFCVWDLRFVEEHSEVKELPERLWWPKYEKQKNAIQSHNLYKYYTDEWIKPCLVKMNPLANEDKLLKEYEQTGFERRHQCLYCPQSYFAKEYLVNHVKSVHPEEFIQCNKINCRKFFRTEDEKVEHDKKEHQVTMESLKCKYCGKMSTNKAKHKAHILKNHRSKILRCSNVYCKQLFITKEERDKHFKATHKSGKYFCCFCDKYFECCKSQWDHMKNNHKGALKCNATRACPNYFKTEEDRKKHVQEKHSKKYKCLYCNGTFSQSGALATHIRKFHKDVALRCEYSHGCPTWFKTEEERQKHYKENHESGDDKVLCPLCSKKFSKLGGIQMHFQTHHKKEKIFKCDYTLFCANYFSSEEDKLKHIQEVHEIHDEKFRCLYCEKLIPKCMYYHITRWHKDVAIKCNFNSRCGHFFKTLEDREKHMREVHLAEKIREAAPCLYCDKILTGKRSLNQHINFKHSKIAIKCQYAMCATFFKSKEDLEEHLSLKPKHKEPLKRMELVPRFKCNLCSKAFHTKWKVKNHIISKHRKDNKKMCPHCKKPTATKSAHIISDFCKVCNKKFRCLGLFRSHTLKCRPVFHCPVCSESFKIQSELTYHCKINHTVPILKWKGLQNVSRGFKCDDCLVYFSLKNSLREHKRNCHGSSSFTCDFCQMQFTNKKNLKLHIAGTHLRLTKHVPCPICNLKFGSEYMKKKHIGTHLTKKFVQCQMCDKVMQNSALRSHIKYFH